MTRTTGIAIVLGVILLGTAAYLMLRPASAPGVSATGAPASEAELTFITLTAKIDPVAFDTSILKDPRFMGLQDIRTVILPEPSGRLDPFSPLAGVVVK
jgi:hypothetical protein